MTFSKEWETQYNQGRQFSLYPWSDLVTLVMRFANPKQFSDKPKVLELGCGVGANISFFIDKGFKYFAIEGAQTATEYIHDCWGDKVNVLCGDFTKEIPFKPGYFDLVVDRASTTHNPTKAIKKVISQVKLVLKPGHLFILSDWFSTRHTEFLRGDPLEKHTRHNYSSGAFTQVGTVHFFDEYELRLLFEQWQILFMEHKSYETFVPNKDIKSTCWNMVVKND